MHGKGAYWGRMGVFHPSCSGTSMGTCPSSFSPRNQTIGWKTSIDYDLKVWSKKELGQPSKSVRACSSAGSAPCVTSVCRESASS